MPKLAHENRIKVSAEEQSAVAVKSSASFQGFASPRSNTTYTPNQFFDLCIPHSSRGVVRLVAYLIRRTLGWCDAEGNPQEERVAVSYQELVARAGISRQMIRESLNEALAGHFIRCVRSPRARASGDAGQTALYTLCWDDSDSYVKDPKQFRGFFEREGNRTDIPNEFFDRLIPNEPLAVIKAVGSIIRFSIGFQAQRGVRRQQVRLSYSDIQRYARIAGRATLSAALATALRRNYILRLEQGVFDPDAGRASRPALYALKWADGYGAIIGQKIEPGEFASNSDHRSEIRTGIGQKIEPEERSDFRTGIEMKQTNETFKQQTELDDAKIQFSWKALKKQGFDSKTANALASRYAKTDIENQIRWLALRNPARNALGMLRRAIEEDWPDPTISTANLHSPGAVFAAHFHAALAGNDGEPVAEPSSRDTAAGERYFSKLTALDDGKTGPADWGCAFARLIAEEPPSLAQRGIFLSFALTLRGDAFYQRQKTAMKLERIRAEQTARDNHLALHRADWIAYLKTEAERVKEERPDDFAQFESHRAEERRRMIESPWAVFIEERLARYDREERRLLDFQKFFAPEILDFWTWDARLNPKPFNPAQPSARTQASTQTTP